MRRVEADPSSYHPPVRLYLDDLEHLVNLMPPNADLTITVGEFEYEGVDELVEEITRPQLSALSLWCSPAGPGYLSVDVKPNGVRVRGSKLINETLRVGQALKGKTPWYSYRSDSGWWALLEFIVVMMLWITLVLVAWVFSGFVVVIAGVGLLAIFSVWGLWFSDRVLLGGSRIILSRKHQRLTFWERRKDQIIVNAISGVIGAAIGFILGRVLRP